MKKDGPQLRRVPGHGGSGTDDVGRAEAFPRGGNGEQLE